MSDPHLPRSGGFRDLVPWADPYIAALIEKLRRLAESEGVLDSAPACAELPPPLDQDDRPDTWQVDWSPRNWPRG